MNYRHEMNSLKKRRRLYLPVMAGLLAVYEERDRHDFPIELIDSPDILLLLELMDIEYLDQETFTVRRRFGDIVSLLYHGVRPFSESGLSFFRRHRCSAALLKVRRALRNLLGI